MCGQEILLVHDLQKERMPFSADQSRYFECELRPLPTRRRLELTQSDAILLLEAGDLFFQRPLIRNANCCQTENWLIAETGQCIQSRDVAGLPTLIDEVVQIDSAAKRPFRFRAMWFFISWAENP